LRAQGGAGELRRARVMPAAVPTPSPARDDVQELAGRASQAAFDGALWSSTSPVESRDGGRTGTSIHCAGAGEEKGALSSPAHHRCHSRATPLPPAASSSSSAARGLRRPSHRQGLWRRSPPPIPSRQRQILDLELEGSCSTAGLGSLEGGDEDELVLHELHPRRRPPTRTNLCEGERRRASAPQRVPSADSFFLQNAVEWLKSKKGKMAVL
jgi:hypothetical protein